jgi:hypothetical protein
METDRVRFLVGTTDACSERIEEIAAELERTTGAIERKVFIGAELAIDAFENEVLGTSLFSPNTLVIVRRMETIEKKLWGRIGESLAKAPSHAWIVFEGTSRKNVPEDHTMEVLSREERAEAELFLVLGKRRVSARELCETASAYLRQNPYGFPLVIGAFEKHLQRALIAGDMREDEFIGKLRCLQDLDYRLKTGAVSSAPGWEALLLRLADPGR